MTVEEDLSTPVAIVATPNRNRSQRQQLNAGRRAQSELSTSLFQERLTNEQEMRASKKMKTETKLELLNDQRKKEGIIIEVILHILTT